MNLRLAVVCALVTLTTHLAVAADGGSKLTVVKGAAWTTAPGQEEAKAVQGSVAAPGTKIRTGNDGQVEIAFDNGSLLKLQPSSSLVLSAAKRQKPKNSIVLFFGRVWSKVTKSDETSYEVNTPNAVCGVRGTEFETGVADDGSARVRVTSGTVAVQGDEASAASVTAGQEVAATDDGVAKPATAEEQAKWEAWQKEKAERLNKESRAVVDRVKSKIMSRKDRLEKLRAEEKSIEAKRKSAESRAQSGDSAAIQEIKDYNRKLAAVADAIADLGDEAASQFGIVDHFADLAKDPRFKNIDRKYLEAEAASLRRVKATLDKMVAEGTDISIQAMDKMLKDMSGGKHGDLKDKDSAAEDLFGKDSMDMK